MNNLTHIAKCLDDVGACYTAPPHYAPTPPFYVGGEHSRGAGALLRWGYDYALAHLLGDEAKMREMWEAAKAITAEVSALRNDATKYRRLSKERAQTRLGQEQTVYFIGAEDGPIKIGIALNPERRLKELQTGGSEKLEILATDTGGRGRELYYHRKFGEFRLKGEWFDRVPEITCEIERLNICKMRSLILKPLEPISAAQNQSPVRRSRAGASRASARRT